tara:strand:- start:44 stop:196 length:153 start_codon:yes stop_codon:yes gene_type:complete
MIKLIALSILLNISDGNIYATMPPDPVRVEARKRGGKGQRGRRRGGSGLR